MATKIFPEVKRFDRYTSLGSYPLFYVLKLWSWHRSAQYAEVCPDCATEAKKTQQWVSKKDVTEHVDEITPEINYEDPALYCDDCGERIPSAYAEDEVDKDIEPEVTRAD
jgi:hypothetical protein